MLWHIALARVFYFIQDSLIVSFSLQSATLIPGFPRFALFLWCFIYYFFVLKARGLNILLQWAQLNPTCIMCYFGERKRHASIKEQCFSGSNLFTRGNFTSSMSFEFSTMIDNCELILFYAWCTFWNQCLQCKERKKENFQPCCK